MKALAYIKRSTGTHWVGDGFPVRSIFSYHDSPEDLSPFLLMDYAGPVRFEPTTRRRGIGAHPHRGFETVTIVYSGGITHRDSAGGGGSVGPGDVQWMTAASGVLHEEFHSREFARHGGPFEMVQLWVNLPAKDKMAKPGYQEITDASIPRVSLPDNAGTLRLITGRHGDVEGAARTFTPMKVWDMRLNAGHALALELDAGHTTALFILRGAIRVATHRVGPGELAVMERDGAGLVFDSIENSVLLLLSGEALCEPVVGQGPFVMNSQDEIAQALRDYHIGRFGDGAFA